MVLPWKKIEEKVDYACGLFRILLQKSVSPLTGKAHPFYVLSTSHWVNVIALTPEKKVVMVSQYRHGSGEVSLEIPGGAVDAKDPSPLEGAQRELLEETGHQAGEWIALGKVAPNPAILDNTCHFFLALDARQTSPLDTDEAEEIELVFHALGEIPEKIRQGEISHALVVSAFHYLDLYRKRNPDKI